MGEDKFAINDGVRIHYETEGNGPAIVMRTGAGGDCQIWRYAGYVDGLDGYRKILMDQRGRGKSDRPSTIESHSIELHVSDINAVLDDAGVERAAYIGYSAGATIGVAFGALNPKRLMALVGLGSLPVLNYSDRPKPNSMADEIKRIVAAGGVKAEYEVFVKQDNDRFPSPIHENVLGGDPLMRALDAVASYSTHWRGPLDAYSAFQAPVLMLSGEREDEERDTEKAVGKFPNARVVRLQGIGHLSTFYRSELTLPHIVPFLKKNLV